MSSVSFFSPADIARFKRVAQAQAEFYPLVNETIDDMHISDPRTRGILRSVLNSAYLSRRYQEIFFRTATTQLDSVLERIFFKGKKGRSRLIANLVEEISRLPLAHCVTVRVCRDHATLMFAGLSFSDPIDPLTRRHEFALTATRLEYSLALDPKNSGKMVATDLYEISPHALIRIVERDRDATPTSILKALLDLSIMSSYVMKRTPPQYRDGDSEIDLPFHNGVLRGWVRAAPNQRLRFDRIVFCMRTYLHKSDADPSLVARIKRAELQFNSDLAAGVIVLPFSVPRSRMLETCDPDVASLFRMSKRPDWVRNLDRAYGSPLSPPVKPADLIKSLATSIAGTSPVALGGSVGGRSMRAPGLAIPKVPERNTSVGQASHAGRREPRGGALTR